MFLAVKSNRHVSGHMEIKGQNVVESRPHSTFYKSRVRYSEGNGKSHSRFWSCLLLHHFPGVCPRFPSFGGTHCLFWYYPSLHYVAKWYFQFVFHSYPAIRADLAFCWIFFLNFVVNWADGFEFLIFFKNVPSTCSFVPHFPLDQFLVALHFSSLKASHWWVLCLCVLGISLVAKFSRIHSPLVLRCYPGFIHLGYMGVHINITTENHIRMLKYNLYFLRLPKKKRTYLSSVLLNTMTS